MLGLYSLVYHPSFMLCGTQCARTAMRRAGLRDAVHAVLPAPLVELAGRPERAIRGPGKDEANDRNDEGEQQADRERVPAQKGGAASR